MRGFGLDMGALLDRKYDIMQQEADARTAGAKREFVAGGDPTAPGRVMSLGGSGVSGGPEVEIDPNAQLQTDLLKAQIASQNQNIASAKNADSLNERMFVEGKRAGNGQYNSRTPDQTQARSAEADRLGLSGYARDLFIATGERYTGAKRGMTKVPGKGKEDKVPMLLAPGEAVLNANAAKKLGRGLIAHLNAYGNAKAAKKGMV